MEDQYRQWLARLPGDHRRVRDELAQLYTRDDDDGEMFRDYVDGYVTEILGLNAASRRSSDAKFNAYYYQSRRLLRYILGLPDEGDDDDDAASVATLPPAKRRRGGARCWFGESR